jgi:soluble epoxide hydrolase / lipid-phosphate phosphatase
LLSLIIHFYFRFKNHKLFFTMAEVQAKAGSTGVDALKPDDPRVQHLDAQIGSYNYHYMLATPENPVATILLVHGWPDLGMAWRYQVPYLQSLGLRVIVPDMLGYGRTSAPAPKEEYTLKKMSGHLKELVELVVGKGEKIILGGHDWGAALVWRMASKQFPSLYLHQVHSGSRFLQP